MSKLLEKENRNKLQRMSNMIRYNNEIHIHDENVAEHSFYTAVYAAELCDILGVCQYDRGLIIEKALIHDIHEIELSDIPHNVKKLDESIEKFCLQFENEFNVTYFFELMMRISGCKFPDAINLIVELADVISVNQYSKQELMFGNKKKFYPILNSSIERINAICNKLTMYFDVEKIDRIRELIFF